MTSNLSLDISRTSESKVLRIFDTSFFLEEPENFLIEVLSPLSTRWITYNVTQGFSLVLNAYSLKLQVLAPGAHPKPHLPLPDGIYTMRMSVKPNFSTVIEYNHLRIKQLQEKYDDTLCNLYSEQCNLTNVEFEEKRKILIGINMDMKAAVSFVEIKHDKDKGLSLYEKATKDLKKFKNECGC